MLTAAKLMTSSSHGRSADRRGFTLVEMLVVIVIITILAAIAIPVVFGVIANAKDHTIAADITNIASGFENYKLEMGAYPPDFAALTPAQKPQAIAQHLIAKFRYRNAADVPQGIDLSTSLPRAADVSTLDPAEAIWFWLRGFSADKQRPLGGPVGATEVTRNSYFDFNPRSCEILTTMAGPNT